MLSCLHLKPGVYEESARGREGVLRGSRGPPQGVRHLLHPIRHRAEGARDEVHAGQDQPQPGQLGRLPGLEAEAERSKMQTGSQNSGPRRRGDGEGAQGRTRGTWGSGYVEGDSPTFPVFPISFFAFCNSQSAVQSPQKQEQSLLRKKNQKIVVEEGNWPFLMTFFIYFFYYFDITIVYVLKRPQKTKIYFKTLTVQQKKSSSAEKLWRRGRRKKERSPKKVFRDNKNHRFSCSPDLVLARKVSES